VARVLIMIAHGSRSATANEEFCALVASVARQATAYAAVVPAFLEVASPSLAQALAVEVGRGCLDFDVYPLFFNRGRHVARDIPEQVAALAVTHPRCEIRLLPYFGAFDGLAEAVLRHLTVSESSPLHPSVGPR
jgi:sirohydrochlorin ferrochelatase